MLSASVSMIAPRRAEAETVYRVSGGQEKPPGRGERSGGDDADFQLVRL